MTRYDLLAWNDGVAYRFRIDEAVTRVYVAKHPIRFEMRLEGTGELDARVAAVWSALEGRRIAGSDMVDEQVAARVDTLVASLESPSVQRSRR